MAPSTSPLPACSYRGFEATRFEPNIVVDGSPNSATILALTHWPGFPVERALRGDLSAHIVFNYLDRLVERGESPVAELVTNNHFDQDGLVCIHTLVHPEQSLAQRELLIDLAAAGDFATYRDRRAARASMVFSRLAEGGDDVSYDEDAELDRCEQALADGTITVEIAADVDFAVSTVPEDFEVVGGHRFGGQHAAGVHPMAINNAVGQFRVLTMQGRRYRYVDRYETWVQYQSRRPLPRVDLRPLADELTAAETGGELWTAGQPGALTPELSHEGESTLAAERVQAMVQRYLQTQPPAWDPYSASS